MVILSKIDGGLGVTVGSSGRICSSRHWLSAAWCPMPPKKTKATATKAAPKKNVPKKAPTTPRASPKASPKPRTAKRSREPGLNDAAGGEDVHKGTKKAKPCGDGLPSLSPKVTPRQAGLPGFFDRSTWGHKWQRSDAIAEAAAEQARAAAKPDTRTFVCFDRKKLDSFFEMPKTSLDASVRSGGQVDPLPAHEAAEQTATQAAMDYPGCDVNRGQTDQVPPSESACEPKHCACGEGDVVHQAPAPAPAGSDEHGGESIVHCVDDDGPAAPPVLSEDLRGQPVDQPDQAEPVQLCAENDQSADLDCQPQSQPETAETERLRKVQYLRDTLFRWPETMAVKIATIACSGGSGPDQMPQLHQPPAEQHRDYLRRMWDVLNSLTLSTSFSGIDSPSSALAMIGAAITSLLGETPCESNIPDTKNLFAIEWLSSSQQQLLDHPFGPKCVFGDITAFYLPSLASKLETIVQQRRTMNTLKPLLLSTVCTGRSGFCEACQQNCSIKEADMHIGGTPCTDFSARGEREELDGKTTTALLSFVGMRRDLQEPFWLQENVVTFPVSLLLEMLSDLYEIQSCVIDPPTLGWPVQRKRQYIIGRHRTKTIPFHMRFTDFISLLYCKPRCGVGGSVPAWDAFFVAKPAELSSELRWAAGRPSSMARNEEVPGPDDFDAFASCLASGERKFLDGFEAIVRNRCYSLTQNPLVTATYSAHDHLHTLIKNAGVIWSDFHKRWLTPNEALLVQGFPIFTSLSYGMAMTSFAEADGDITDKHNATVSRTSKIGMAGNAMHLECVGAAMMYVITHGAMPLSSIRASGLTKCLCKRFDQANLLSSTLNSFARLVSGRNGFS